MMNAIKKAVFGVLALLSTAGVVAAPLASAPLSLKGSVPPNVLFALSVEFPTANTAAYQGTNDYTSANQYLGLFDPKKCYAYDSGNGWFYPLSITTTQTCAGQWSGNFLNWATMTGLDEFRYAMTGGNRYQDTSTLTVLERTYQSGQGGTANFPDKATTAGATATAGSTPFDSTSLTIQNQGKGVAVAISGTTPSTVTCSGTLANSSPYCTSFTLSNGHTGTCKNWGGDGSTTSKAYTCTAFNVFSGSESLTISGGCTTTGKNSGGKYVCTTQQVTYPLSATTYQVRIKVCDTSVGLESNCQGYGSTYKPTGVIQNNGDKMRFGVFSYYNANDIDNAVMRSRLKYVAPQMYSSSGGNVSNTNAEWLSADGTLVNNPDPADASASYPSAVSQSGVINYINKFGKASGNYKTYDDVGKVYYEALKYLRGLQPTTDFYTRATAAGSDAFPIITSWDDPLLFSCQRNYIITMGDSHTWCDKRLPGGSYTTTGNSTCNAQNGQAADQGSLPGDTGVNVTTWTTKIGAMEGKPTLATDMTGAGGASYYMSGLAYWAALNDIRPDDATKVQTLGNQNVKSYVIDVEESQDLGVGTQYWYAAKYGGADSFSANGTPQNWSQNVNIGTAYRPTLSSAYVGYNGAWPKTLLRAGDPQSMISAVQSAISTISAQVMSEAALAQSAGDLRTSNGAYIYRAIFSSNGWTGDLQAFHLSSTGTIGSTPEWSAASLLPAAASRLIFTYNDGLTPTGATESTSNAYKGVVFSAASNDPALASNTNFSSRQKALLNTNDVATVDNFGADRVNYLRGNQSNEGTQGHGWRARNSRLGDIVNSNPVYVGLPAYGLTGTGYSDFASGIFSRKPMVYVGGNDGMLHGFDASPADTVGATPGQELIAFVPSAIYGKLNQYMSPRYSHNYYVDGSPTVSEACFGSCASSSDWKTILVGGLNAGGQGIYALDVTNPANFTASNAANIVLWEFTDRNDPDLGYTFSKPLIKKMNNGRWAAIFGNGFQNTYPDSSVSTTGRAYLYIVYVDGPGSGHAWSSSNYVKIALKSPNEPTNPTLPLNPANGLSSAVGVDVNLDGTVDYIYAGDQQGNMWKIDVTSTDPTAWGAAFGTTANPLPLFTATDPSGNRQRITTGVELSRHPNGGYMVLFGTGSYIETTDALPPFKTDSYYGIWDNMGWFDPTTNQVSTGSTVSGRSALQPQQILTTQTSGGDLFSFMSQCPVNYTTSPLTFTPTVLCPAAIAQTNVGLQRGWVFDFPGSGERVASDHPLVEGGIVTFTSRTPASDPCTGNITGWEYDVSYLTGGASSQGVFDLDGNGFLNSLYRVTTSLVSGGANLALPPSGRRLNGASDTPVRLQTPPPTASSGTGTQTTACPDFIPGWGCPSQLALRNKCVIDVTSGELIGATGNSLAGSGKCFSTPTGRMLWRQIIR